MRRIMITNDDGVNASGIIRLAKAGVDGLITDVPDFAREVLEKNNLI